jgi:hypothetical protein
MIANELVQDLVVIILLLATTPLLGLVFLYGINRVGAWRVGQ